jgi:hypothetical protein
MEQNKKSNTVWWIVGVVVLVLIVILLVKGKGSDMAGNTDMQNGDQTALEATEDTSAGSVNTPTSGTASVTMSYAKALETYKDRRIQFNDECQAVPNTVTYKDNTGIMLDNRSSKSRTIKIGTSYTVKGYGFKIITLPDTYRQSKTFLVDCDGQQNVATILVQE